MECNISIAGRNEKIKKASGVQKGMSDTADILSSKVLLLTIINR
uniref:Uncharacterized protein n=1 Tax=Heterorhabditis bacteriophora TaxID=37862 RepID=A0A1I7WB05_HETBA